MTTTREFPDWKLDLLRNAGALVCQCLAPVRVSLTLWRTAECARCGKKIT